jgi:PhnB protein
MKIPSQYLPVMPYLIVRNAQEFLDFTKTVLGAREQMIVPAEDHGIMHGEIRINDAVIMFADAGGQWGERPAGMYIYIDDVTKVYKAALDNGAKSLMPPEKKDYGFTAGFEDTFGNQWWIVEAEKN